MLSSERQAFEQQLAVLFHGFDEPMSGPRTEAYWRAVMPMPILVFERLVDYAIGPNGPEAMPTPKQMWSLQRSMRQYPPSAGSDKASEPKNYPEIDLFESFANVRLIEFLIAHPPGASEDSLVEMVRKARQMAAGYQQEARRDPRYQERPRLVFFELKTDMAQVLASSFEMLFVPIGADEAARILDVVSHTGHTPGFTETGLAILQERLL